MGLDDARIKLHDTGPGLMADPINRRALLSSKANTTLARPAAARASAGVDLVEQLRVAVADSAAEGGPRIKVSCSAPRPRRRNARLVIARHYPDLAAMLDPYLRRAQHMAGRMQRYFHAADIAHLAVTFCLQRHNGTEPRGTTREFAAAR